jgi:hypothetical protein
MAGFFSLGDVLHYAFDGNEFSLGVENARPALPRPAQLAGGVKYPVLDVEALGDGQAVPDFRTHALAVVRMRQRFVRNAVVQQQIARLEAGEAPTALADELHRPIRVVAAAIDHPVQIAEQRLEHARGVDADHGGVEARIFV